MKHTPASIRRKVFVKAIVEGNSASRAYKESSPSVTDNTAKAEGYKYLAKPCVQEELARQLAEITPENITARIDDIARSAPMPETKLKALIALGNTRKASIFKDSTPSITNNTLNVFDLDDLRRRLADNTYNQPVISD